MKAVLYARFSPRPDAAESESCKYQLLRCRQYAEAKEWEVIGEFQDEGVSGSDPLRNPGFHAAMGAAVKHKAVLVAHQLDRLGRPKRISDLEDAMTKLTEHAGGLAFVSGDMNFDTSTAGGRLMLRIMLTYANYTREIMSERTSDSMKAHQKRGRAVGGTAPYGFSKVGSRLIENPDEAAGLRRMLELHGQGLGLRAICRSLTRERHPPRGSQWYPQTVRRSLERAGEWLNQPAAQS